MKDDVRQVDTLHESWRFELYRDAVEGDAVLVGLVYDHNFDPSLRAKDAAAVIDALLDLLPEAGSLLRHRLAEVERADVVAHLDEDLARHRKALKAAERDEAPQPGARVDCLRGKVSLLQTQRAYIHRGDHVGASERGES